MSLAVRPMWSRNCSRKNQRLLSLHSDTFGSWVVPELTIARCGRFGSLRCAGAGSPSPAQAAAKSKLVPLAPGCREPTKASDGADARSPAAISPASATVSGSTKNRAFDVVTRCRRSSGVK
jgi:hypothetical protein